METIIYRNNTMEIKNLKNSDTYAFWTDDLDKLLKDCKHTLLAEEPKYVSVAENNFIRIFFFCKRKGYFGYSIETLDEKVIISESFKITDENKILALQRLQENFEDFVKDEFGEGGLL